MIVVRKEGLVARKKCLIARGEKGIASENGKVTRGRRWYQMNRG